MGKRKHSRQMGKRKQNKMVVHWLIVLVSVLSGLGIWAAVNKPEQSSASLLNSAVVLSAPGSNVNFDYNDTFLRQTYVQPRTAPRFRTRGS